MFFIYIFDCILSTLSQHVRNLQPVRARHSVRIRQQRSRRERYDSKPALLLAGSVVIVCRHPNSKTSSNR